MDNQQVQLKAMCIFQKDGKILVSKGKDDGKEFYRFLGGHIEFFETGEQGVRREIMEELGSEIDNLKFIGMEENLFTYQGKKWHEIDFLYSGDLSKKDLYNQNPVRVKEPGYEFEAEWVAIKEIFDKNIPLYPKFDYKTLFKEML